MSFCMQNSKFIAFHRNSLSTPLNLNFDPKWLRTKKIIQHSYCQDRFEYPMWISHNLKMVEFRTNLLPDPDLECTKLNEFKTLPNCYDSKQRKWKIISCAYFPISMSFCMHNSSFLAIQCISLSARLNLNFDPKWLRTKKIMQHSYYQDRFEYPMWISYNLKMVEFRTNLLPDQDLECTKLNEFKTLPNCYDTVQRQ